MTITDTEAEWDANLAFDYKLRFLARLSFEITIAGRNLVAEAKFHENPDDIDIWGSPFVPSLARKISDAMLDSYRLAGKPHDVERHQQWLNSLSNNIVFPVVKAQLKRDAQGRQWPLEYEAKAAYVKGCIAPFLATEAFIRQLMDDAEAA